MTESLIINFLVYIIVNLFLFTGWFTFFKSRYNFQKQFNFVLTFIFGLTQILLTSFFLGLIIKRLYSVELFLLNILISCILLYLGKFNPRNLLKVFSTIKNEINQLNKRDVVLWAFILIAVFTVINLLILIVVHPPTSWDDYHYHLGFVADIIKTGEIRYFDYTHLYTISFPHDIEIFNLWNMIFFKNDFIVEVTNLYFLIFSGGVIYLLCRHFGSNKRLAIIGGLLVFSIPILLMVSKTTKVDIAIWAFLMASLYLLLNINFKEIFKSRNFILFLGICFSLGIIFGSKSSAVIYVVVFYLGFLAIFLKQVGWRNALKPLVILTTLIVSFLFLLGSFWYFRSWYYFDNPLFPVDFKILGIHFPGEWQSLDFATNLPQIESRNFIQKLIYVWEEREAWSGVFYIADGKLEGLGSIWFIFLLPSLLITLLISILKKNLKLFVFMIVPSVILLALPGNWISHYSGFICMAGIVPFIYLLNNYINSRVGRGLVLIILFMLYCLAFLLTLNGTFFRPVDTYKKIVNAENIIYSNSLKTRDMNILINNTVEAGQNVVMGGKVWFPYALMKSDFSNNTVFIPAIGNDDPNWLTKVAEVNPVYVVVLDGMPEIDIINNHPELFEKLITDIDGPHYLFAYKPNISTKKVIKDETFENNLNKIAAVKDYKLTEMYGVKNFEVSFYINKPLELKDPIIFFHIFPNSGGNFINLDFKGSMEGSIMTGSRTIPPQYNSIRKIRLGITNFNTLNTYTFYETEI